MAWRAMPPRLAEAGGDEGGCCPALKSEMDPALNKSGRE